MTTDPSYVADHAGRVVCALVSASDLSPLLPAAREQTLTAAMGAVVTFEGVVRDHDGGRGGVTLLEYAAHPSAEAELSRVAAQVAARWPVRLWVAHRTGALRVGELAFVVMAAAAHRGDAFAAACACADLVKEQVPLWKRQERTDGPGTWVGLE